jgi:hypothetical protein
MKPRFVCVPDFHRGSGLWIYAVPDSKAVSPQFIWKQHLFGQQHQRNLKRPASRAFIFSTFLFVVREKVERESGV